MVDSTSNRFHGGRLPGLPLSTSLPDNQPAHSPVLPDSNTFPRFIACALFAGLWFIPTVPRAQEAPASQKLQVPPPLAPAESMKKIHLPEGFRVELAAAEPLVLDPVAFDWDERGRLWVVEMADYPMGMDGKDKPGGRVRILEDSDGDGRYDRAELFAEGLNFPNGILCWKGGALVTAAPEILYLQDKDSDGRAETREVLFQGFHEGNQQLRVNGLRWGQDNWVYGAIGAHVAGYGAGTKLKSLRTGQEVALGARDFRFRPDTGEIDPQSGPTQFGRNRDDWGRWFGTQNSWPLWHYVLQDHYLRRNPHFAAPSPRLDLVTPANPKVFPVSPPAKRYHDFKSSGHFTAACSGILYRDDLLFAGETGIQAFICEPAANLIQRQVLQEDGVSFKASRSPQDQAHDFFASEDPWCRPVMVRPGPDGALWVADMYRFMIEHPHWLPKNGKEELLPYYRLGEDRGRIYRILPAKGAPRVAPRLDQLDAAGLVAALDSPNGWQRDKVQQVLLWRNDATAVPLLEKLAVDSDNPLARLHALCTLDGLQALKPELVEQALRDPHPGVRENALRLAETRGTPAVIAEAVKRITEQDPKLLLQLAFSLGAWEDPRAGAALGQLAVSHGQDPWIRAAIMSSAVPHAGALVETVLQGNPEFVGTWRPLLFAQLLGLADRSSLARLLAPVLTPRDGQFTSEQIEGFHEFLVLLQRKRIELSELQHRRKDDELSRILSSGPNAIFDHTTRVAGDDKRPPRERIAAASLLGTVKERQQDASVSLASWLTAQTPPETLKMAVHALANLGADDLPERFAKAWGELGPETRAVVLDEWLRRESWALDFLQRVESGKIPVNTIDTTRRSRLLQHHAPAIKRLAAKVFDASSSPSRASVVQNYQSALTLKGEPTKGREVYRLYCSACHKHGTEGRELGPDLASVAEHPPEKLLSNILDPNIDIQPGYQAYTCVLKSGEELYGLVTAETAHSFTLVLPDGTKRVVLRQDVSALRGANLSLMPEGLEAATSQQDMAHLIQFLRTPLAEQPAKQ